MCIFLCFIAGDHGGESDDEVTAALFIYSPNPLISFETDSSIISVKQVDLIPTLASTLGVPVPFSNLGSLILDAFPTSSDKENSLSNWQQALIALWSNVEQITTYINRYGESSTQLNSSKLKQLQQTYAALKLKVNEIKDEMEFRSFVKEAKLYLTAVRATCEEVWIQFDSFSMSRGLLIVFLTIFFTYMVTDGIPTNKLSEILYSSFLFCSYTMMGVATLVSLICFYLSLVESLDLTIFFSTGIVSVLMLAIVVIQNWETIAIHWYECTQVRQWMDFACRIVLLFFISILFSNSYILEEAGVLSYLVLALVIFIIYNSITQKPQQKLNSKPKWSSFKTKLIVIGFIIGVLIRSSMYFWRCREEQKWCINFSFEGDIKLVKDSEKVQCIITLVFLALLVTTTRIWLRSCGNLVGFSPTVTLTRYAPTVIVVCSAGFWVLHRLPKETKSKLVAGWQVDILAWTVYCLVSLGLLSVILQPLCVYILPKRKETVSVYGEENVIPQIFNQVKGLYQGNAEPPDQIKETPVVYGLGTVYSASFIVISILVCLVISLLLGDRYAPASVIMYFTAALMLALLSIVHFERASKIRKYIIIIFYTKYFLDFELIYNKIR